MNAATCVLLGGHCRHWGLTDAEHALTHALVRRINEVAEADKAAGLALDGSGSTTSVAQDGSRLRQLLAEEGYQLCPAAGTA